LNLDEILDSADVQVGMVVRRQGKTLGESNACAARLIEGAEDPLAVVEENLMQRM
jgi:hypothetical protein